MFHEVIPNTISEYDPQTDYWPSSSISSSGKKENRESGDIHYWGAWFGKRFIEDSYDVIGRFVSEWGYQSFPSMNTIQKFTSPEDRSRSSDVMLCHQRANRAVEKMSRYMKKYYKIPDSFEDFVYLSQLQQAWYANTTIEAHRVNKPYCMGTLYWQLNDCWPVVSWSGMDYYFNWKAMNYGVKHANKNVHVISKSEKDSVLIWVASDSLKEIPIELEMTVLNFNGEIIKKLNQKHLIKENTSQLVFSDSFGSLIAIKDSSSSLLRTSIKSNNKLLDQDVFYFTYPKYLDLEKDPSISTRSSKTKNGLQIDLTSDRLVKDLYLSFDNVEGRFSDNYFDLLPGTKRTIHFFPKKGSEIPKNINSKLRYKSLNNTL